LLFELKLVKCKGEEFVGSCNPKYELWENANCPAAAAPPCIRAVGVAIVAAAAAAIALAP
jgi:hypothetical protein